MSSAWRGATCVRVRSGSGGAMSMSAGTRGRRRRNGPSLRMFQRLIVGRGDAAEASLAAGVVGERLRERRLVEIRPQAVDEMEFGVRTFPQQEVAQASLAAGADQEVHGRRGRC